LFVDVKTRGINNKKAIKPNVMKGLLKISFKIKEKTIN